MLSRDTFPTIQEQIGIANVALDYASPSVIGLKELRFGKIVFQAFLKFEIGKWHLEKVSERIILRRLCQFMQQHFFQLGFSASIVAKRVSFLGGPLGEVTRRPLAEWVRVFLRP